MMCEPDLETDAYRLGIGRPDPLDDPMPMSLRLDGVTCTRRRTVWEGEDLLYADYDVMRLGATGRDRILRVYAVWGYPTDVYLNDQHIGVATAIDIQEETP